MHVATDQKTTCTHLRSCTEMGGEGAFLTPEESVTPFIAFLKGVTKEHSGGFFDYKGQRKPW